MRVQTLLSTALVAAAFAAPAWAHPITYIGTLSNLGEPAPANLSLGTGNVALTVDVDTFTMRVQVTFSNLTGNVSNSHIHCCTPTAFSGSAGVATPLPTFPGFPGTGAGIPDVKAGSYDQTFDMTLASSWNPAFVTANGGTTGSAFSALATGIASGKAYLNIHTSFVPGGEIRAFVTAVPEPETYAMMFGGLALVGAMLRRRRQS